MKNKHLIFIFMLAAAATGSTYCIDSKNMPTADQAAPMNASDQARIDHVIESLNFGPKYKGYITPFSNALASLNLNNDKIFVDKTWFENASTNEVNFVLGHMIAYKKMSLMHEKEDSIFRGYVSIWTILCGGTLGLLGPMIAKSQSRTIYVAAGIALGTTIAFTTFKSKLMDIIPRAELQIYADHIAVTKLNCHQAAIDMLKKYRGPDSQDCPSNQERIKNIECLLKKKPL